MDRESPMFRDEFKTMEAMVGIYCRGNHGVSNGLCDGCRELLDYAMVRLETCPFGEEKPVCSKCTVHCYRPEMREKVQDVMRYAGPRMLKEHPILAARHMMRGVRKRPGK